MLLKRHYKNFEETLLLLLKDAKKGPVSVHTFLTILSGRGKILLLILLSLGWAGIPVVGIATGFFISYLGISIAAGKNFIWMPKFFCRKQIASSILIKIIDQILKALKFMKRWSLPRYEWVTQKTPIRVTNGLMITLVGLCLAASPPLPLIGFVACFAIFLMAIGILNDDGVYLILGYLVALFYLATILTLLNYFSFSKIFEWIKHILP